MAVPKQKKGRGATHTRRSANMKLEMPSRSVCPQCGAPKLPTAGSIRTVRSLSPSSDITQHAREAGRMVGLFCLATRRGPRGARRKERA